MQLAGTGLPVPGLRGFVGGTIAGDVALIVIAVIPLIFEIGSIGNRMDPMTERRVLVETTEAVTLVEFADRVGNVVQLCHNGVLNFAETDNQPDDKNGGDEHELSADDEASFIAQQMAQHERFLLGSGDIYAVGETLPPLIRGQANCG